MPQYDWPNRKTTRDEIYKLIDAERLRQDMLHPEWRGDYHGLSVLMEETGEVARGLYEANNATSETRAKWWNDNLESELVQVAATAIRWLENRQ